MATPPQGSPISHQSSTDQRRADEEYCLQTGLKLWGDDFTPDEIAAWFADEANGYYALSHAQTPEHQAYGYHALNQYHGFHFLPDRIFDSALGFGAAYGDEYLPILPKLRQITILEPGAGFQVDNVGGVPAKYVTPDPSGIVPFDPASFDLITCFGVLHHVPNVSTVVREIFRILKPDGYALLREPVVSMGDWRKPRPGATKRERGIPAAILSRMVRDAGFEIVREARCMFPPIPILCHRLHIAAWNSPSIVRFDAILCRLPIWPRTYHATTTLARFRPASAYYVLRKPL